MGQVWLHIPPSSNRDFISQSLLAYPLQPKSLSFSDDFDILLSDPGRWDVLLGLQSYGSASNAKVNIDKTVVLSMSGVPQAC
ncbi:hypothetical protein INT47_003511 [Mucor saturninus]|uniref:Uncharacterized protein n=1 Tax=Mucor saturninus TaxID=64648 RepID=A0A8H7UPP3_9FUNG|nr:hypothetical protein INT47_003511 [Mucor saturninus]